jgi:hypothetical protein
LSFFAAAASKQINKQAEQTEFKEDHQICKDNGCLLFNVFTLHDVVAERRGLGKENYGNLWVIIQNSTHSSYYALYRPVCTKEFYPYH